LKRLAKSYPDTVEFHNPRPPTMRTVYLAHQKRRSEKPARRSVRATGASDCEGWMVPVERNL
jgi:hypothetical protein